MSEVCSGKLAIRVPYIEGLQAVLVSEKETAASATVILCFIHSSFFTFFKNKYLYTGTVKWNSVASSI
jgi:hypothetical protein